MKKPIATIAAFALLCGAAVAQPPPPPPPGQPGSPGPMSLGLSPDQAKRVDALHKDFGPRMRALEKSLQDKRRAQETLYKQFTLDTGQAKQLNKEINGIQKDILDLHLGLQLELRKILTADQFSRLRTGMERRRPMERWNRPRN